MSDVEQLSQCVEGLRLFKLTQNENGQTVFVFVSPYDHTIKEVCVNGGRLELVSVGV